MKVNANKILFPDAHSYGANSKLQEEASIRFLNSHKFIGDESVLDIGCGTGRLANIIAERVPYGNVTGIDNSPAMIELAKQKHNKSNLKFMLMDADDVSFANKFDFIISTFCFHWVRNKVHALKAVGQHLNPNAALMFIMPIQHTLIAKIKAEMMSNKWCEYFIDYSDPAAVVANSNYEEYAIMAGLRNVNVKYEEVTTIYDDSLQLQTFLKNINPCIQRLPVDVNGRNLQDDFIKELVENYLANHPPQANGKCYISYKYAKLTANK